MFDLTYKSTSIRDALKVHAITRFEGKYECLRNFAPTPIKTRGVWFPTLEHAYVANKVDLAAEADMLRSEEDVLLKIARVETPGKVKRLGRKMAMRHGWDDMKADIMLDLVRWKFCGGILAHVLRGTGDRLIIEGNHHGDDFFGMKIVDDRLEGRNVLGQCLMIVRDELQKDEQARLAACLKGSRSVG